MARSKPIAPAVNREEWLTRAVLPLTDIINESGVLTLDRDVRVSCGWPGGKSVNKVIGQCWPTSTAKGTAQLFISPVLTDPVYVLRVLLHELIHAADDCEHGHTGAFARCFKAIGMTGKPTQSEAGEELIERLSAVAAGLGDYPHSGITPGQKVAKPQTTRMIKAECPDCGYIVRTTQKWLDVATPRCPDELCASGGDEMVVDA